MKITPRNLVQHELIGLKAKIVKSTHSGYIGIEGTVVDETMKTIKIMHGSKIKTIPKKCVTIHFTLPNGSIVEVDGKVIFGRPEDRVKKRLRRRW